MLAGGNCMVPGFKKRLLQELRHLTATHPEFEELKVHTERIAIPQCIYAPNVTHWVGASLLMSLGKEVDRFLVTAEKYNEAYCRIPDRFGDAFLTFNRKGLYFNKEFEVNLKQ